MKIISAARLAEATPYRDIVEALRQGFRDDIETPVRHQHRISEVAVLLLMPAWSKAFTGLKTVVFKSDNPVQGLPTITANYLLIDNRTGATVAMMDGTELTRRRTAAASALAADYLARKDASTMLMVGTGALAAHFVRAHAAMRPIRTVLLYNRSPGKARALAAELAKDGFDAAVADDLEKAMGAADIISCATTSTAPILRGKWLKPGTHVDLAGAFTPEMRETDGEAVARARVYVDTREGAEAEAGDLLQAVQEGKFRLENVQGDLFGLCRGKTAGRRNSDEITLFKSCGTAIEDLAAATLVYSRS
ncbi:MAG: ornithine cyclodeaminase family protein [Parvibaculaceae bacterium]